MLRPDEVGELVRHVRIGAGTSTYDLGRHVGLTDRQLRRIENGEHLQGLLKVACVFAALGFEARLVLVPLDPDASEARHGR